METTNTISITNDVRILAVIPVISELPVELLKDLSLQTIGPDLVVIAAASHGVCVDVFET